MKAKGGGVKSTRRRRDPDATRAAILEAAGMLLAKDGPEGLHVSQVAQLANVNRGTAYQHFQSREQLVDATTQWVSEQLRQAVFGSAAPVENGGDVSNVDPQDVIEHLSQFAMENPELGRAWLFQVLSSSNPASDPFWKAYMSRFARFAESDLAQPGIDVEVNTVLTLIGAFLWPVWARAHAQTPRERQKMAQRYSNEVVRLSLHGSMRPERYPELDERLKRQATRRKTAGRSD